MKLVGASAVVFAEVVLLVIKEWVGWGQIRAVQAFLQGHISGCLDSSNSLLVQVIIMVGY